MYKCPHIESSDEGTSYCNLASKNMQDFKRMEDALRKMREGLGNMSSFMEQLYAAGQKVVGGGITRELENGDVERTSYYSGKPEDVEQYYKLRMIFEMFIERRTKEALATIDKALGGES